MPAGPRLARRLPAWHWARIVRTHAPAVPAVRAVLFALYTRMDRDGEAFPSQALIAADTAFSERTVREALLEARRSCWLALIDSHRPGQGWRCGRYVACVPEDLDLASINLGGKVDLQRIVDQCLGVLGAIEDPLHGQARHGGDRAKARTPKGAAAKSAQVKAAMQPAMASARSVGSLTQEAFPEAFEAPDVGGNGRRQMAPLGPDAEGSNMRTPSPTKSGSEDFNEDSTREGHAPGRATTGWGRDDEDHEDETSEPGTEEPLEPQLDEPPAPLPMWPARGPIRRRALTSEQGLTFAAALVDDYGDDPEKALEAAQRAGYPVTLTQLHDHLQARGSMRAAG